MELTIGSLHLTEIQKIIKGELKNKSGIYAFLCKTTNDLYIGSSIQLSSRFNDHITGYNSNIKLQNAINKYSLEDFIFIILEYYEPEKLISQEQFYFNIIKPDYNINLIAGSRLGSMHSEESIAKMSEAKSDMNNPMFNKTHSEETKALMSFAQSGDKHPMFGKTHSKESIALMSQVHLGKTHTVETKVKIALSLGKKVYLYDKDNLNIFLRNLLVIERLLNI